MEYVQLVCALIGVIGLILLFFWALRKLNKGILTTGGKRLKILDRASLGGEKSVVVVSVAGKCMVLGVTSGRIDKIEDLDMTEEEYLEQLYPADTDNNTNGGFFAAFTDALAKNVRSMKKGGSEGRKRGSQSEKNGSDGKAQGYGENADEPVLPIPHEGFDAADGDTDPDGENPAREEKTSK